MFIHRGLAIFNLRVITLYPRDVSLIIHCEDRYTSSMFLRRISTIYNFFNFD